MNNLVSRSFLVPIIIVLGACAETATVGPNLASDGPLTVCEISSSDLDVVLDNAMERLLTDWPVLDRKCEAFGRKVEVSSAGECLVSGKPVVAEGCDDTDYSYKVAFDPKTLEAYQVYWTSE